MDQKAHAGIQGNETADELAKIARSGTGHLPYTVANLKTIAGAKITKEVNSNARKPIRNNPMRELQPYAAELYDKTTGGLSTRRPFTHLRKPKHCSAKNPAINDGKCKPPGNVSAENQRSADL